MTKKKNYSEEFKKSSSELAVTGTKSISQTAKDLGVNANTLYGWIEKYHPGKKTNVNSQVEISVYEELKLLKKQNLQLKMERDILKKAAAYFAKEIM